MNEKPILEVNEISKKFKQFSLTDISFKLPAGYIMGYVGQNGAGKTTTLNLITQLFKKNSGTIRVNGITYDEDPIAYKEAIGYVGDESYFPLTFTVKDVKGIMKDFFRTFDENKFDEIVSEWNLPLTKKVKDYSKGMKVKLMFATIFARDTKLLILDEATSGLDPIVRSEVLDLLQDYIADGERSVLFSTHILNDLEKIADYIFFIDNGKKVLYDSKDEIIENYVMVKGGVDDLNEELAKQLIGITKSQVGFEALLESDKVEYLSRELLVEKASIDHIVLHYIRQMKGKKVRI
mgnify:CR=1 FL=1